MFCGTWYLPHSQVHNDLTVPTVTAGCTAHMQTTVKSDITIGFLDPDFLKDAEISAIRPYIRIILHIFHCACAKTTVFPHPV